MATHAAGGFIGRLRRAVGPEPSDAGLVEAYRLGRDEAAFAALVRRHGPMVLGVCRRVLRNEADAHDAFQATFLVLVRKAGSLRDPGRVSNWLYGVAYHTATKARAAARRRREAERSAAAVRADTLSTAGDDLAALLDAELAGLPDVYRQVLVLCDLQGRTIRDAADQLGWPVGTAATRLTRGRARLALRLLARGLGPTTAAVAAGVPAALVTSTVQAATAFAARSPGPVPAAAQLAEGVLRAMTVHKLKVMTAVLVAAGVVVAGVGRFVQPARADGPAAAPAPAAQKKEAAPPADEGQAALAKQLEGRMWYLNTRYTKGDVINVSDDLKGMASVGLEEHVLVAGPTGPLALRNLPVAKDAKVSLDGQPAKLADLPNGSPLTLKFGDKLIVTEVAAKSAKPGYVIKAVDTGKKALIVTGEKGGEALTFAVTEKPYIYLYDKGNEGTLADLAAGMRVQMVAAVEGGKLVVNDIRARK